MIRSFFSLDGRDSLKTGEMTGLLRNVFLRHNINNEMIISNLSLVILTHARIQSIKRNDEITIRNKIPELMKGK